MSDFFIGELLVLLLLLPVVLRPFVRRLQGISGIVFLPPFALLICVLIIVGSGFLISFVPLLLVTFILVIAGFPRMMRAMRNLSTEWYSLPSSVFYGLFLPILLAVIFGAFFFAPETAYLGTMPIIKKMNFERVSQTISVRHCVWETESNIRHRGTVIFLPDAGSDVNSRNTAACILAEKGYTVYANDYYNLNTWKNRFMAYSAFRRTIMRVSKITEKGPLFTNFREVYLAQQEDFSRTLAWVRTEMQLGPLFVLSEGSACAPTAEYLRTFEEDVRGFICLAAPQMLVETEFALDTFGFERQYTKVCSQTVMTPRSASEKPALLLSGEEGTMIGNGELDADDILAAILLKGNRDAGRRRAERLARRITDWCDSRNQAEEIQ